MSKVYTPFSDQKSPKAIPFGHIPILYGLYKSTPPPPTSKFTQISCHCFNFVYFKHQVNHRHTNIWSAVSLSFKRLKVKQKHRSKCWNHMVVYLNSPSLPYINILGSQGANFYVSCSILPTSWIKPRAGVTKDSKCLTPRHTWRHHAPNSSVGLPVSKPNQLCKQYPVCYQDRLAWNYIPYLGPERTKTILSHTQSSGTSPYEPSSGVYPTGVKRTVMLQSAVETPQEHTHIMGYKWKKAVFSL